MHYNGQASSRALKEYGINTVVFRSDRSEQTIQIPGRSASIYTYSLSLSLSLSLSY
jgi:hypothetical protein